MPVTPTAELLRNVAAMTRSRDHGLLDYALLQTLVDLFGAGRRRFLVHLYRVSEVKQSYRFTLSAWHRDGGTHCGEEDPGTAPLAPQLLEAVRHQAMQFADAPGPGGSIEHCSWLPIGHEGQVLACLELRGSRPLTAKQITLAGGVLVLYGNYLSLLCYSETDTLTRLLNRKTFEDSLRRILETQSIAAPLAPGQERRQADEAGAHWLGVIDIDRFKQINDRYGHLFGDEVLILMADEMRRVFRRADKLFRFGGEEFVVILRHTSARNALRAFERFRRDVESRTFPQVGRVTVSIGATRILPEDTSTTVLGRADDALYYAKEHGRNQLRFHEALVAEGALTKPAAEMAVEFF